MKTLIVGLGNIGTIYSWALSGAGVNVTHIVRAVGMALYAGGIEELATNAALMLFMMHAVRDSLKVLEKRGVDVTRYPDTKPYLEDPIDEFPASYANKHPQHNLRTADSERQPLQEQP